MHASLRLFDSLSQSVRQPVCLCLSFSHTPTHMHTQDSTLPRSLTHSHKKTKHTQDSKVCVPSLPRLLSYLHTYTHTHTHTHKHTHTHTQTNTHKQTHTIKIVYVLLVHRQTNVRVHTSISYVGADATYLD